MKVIKCTKYGSPDVLRITEIEKPVPQQDEVLIKIHAASVTAADMMMRKGSPYIGRLFIGLKKPKHDIVGTGFAGEVEAVGKNVTQFKIGDDVFGESIFSQGTNAEYVCVAEDGVLAKKPDNMSYEEACPACDGALTSLNFIRDVAKAKKGQSILIVGASGSLGTAAVQISKHFELDITAVCSGANAKWVKALGAGEVIDYLQTDFTHESASREIRTYDIIYDTLGKHSFSICKNNLKETGIYMSPVFSIGNLFQMLLTSNIGKKKAKFSATGMRPVAELREMLNELTSLYEADIVKSVIDKKYSLDHTVDAHHYVETGHKKGNVVITF